MRGAASLGGDPKLRTPMSWTADTSRAGFTTGTPFRALSANVSSHNVQTQQANTSSLLNWYRSIIALRKAYPSLTRGAHAGALASGTTLSFQRVDGNQRAVVLINYGTAQAVVNAAGLPANAILANAFPSGDTDVQADANGNVGVGLQAQSLRVFIVD